MNLIVGRVMKSIMTYECGSCFCYLGLNEDKVAFKSFTICEIVIGEFFECIFSHLFGQLQTFFYIFTISDGVREVHKTMTRDAVESKIKNWLRHCPRYALKNNEDGTRNGEDEVLQDDIDF